MKHVFLILFSVLLISALVACNLPKSGTPENSVPNIVATELSSTLAALTEAAIQNTPLPSPTVKFPTNTAEIILSPTPSPSSGSTPTLTLTLAATITPIPKPGTITGAISGYPYGALPKLAIVAYGQEPPYNYSYIITTSGDSYYALSSSYLLPGEYQVVAYDSSNHTGGCPAMITVISDQTVTCDITQWGTGYPAKPSGVPDP